MHHQNMTGTGQDASVGQAKKSKPAMEKRRRARINASLLELRDLIPESKQRLNKMEKADILEMTVKHLKRLQETNKALEKNNPSSKSYSLGFDECTQEVSEFFRPSSPFTSELKLNLLNHLRKCAPHNPPDSPSSSPSKSVTVATNSSNPTSSTTATHTITSTSNTVNTSRNVSASVADSILSRCLLSTFPTTSSSIGLRPNTNAKTNPSPNIIITSDRNNVSTPIAVSSTSDDPPAEPARDTEEEPHIEIVREPSVEPIPGWISRMEISEERSPSPSQIASSRILTMINKSTKSHSSKFRHGNHSNANIVRRDLFNAFQEENDNNTMVTAQTFNDANNNNCDTAYRERDSVIVKECEKSRYVPIRCKSDLIPIVSDRQQPLYKSCFVEPKSKSNHKIFSQNSNVFISHIPIMCGSENDTSMPTTSTINETTTNYSQSDKGKLDNSNVLHTNGSVTSDGPMDILPNSRVDNDKKILNHQSQTQVECSPTCLIPIYIQTEGNDTTQQTLVINNAPAISSETKYPKQKEGSALTNDNKLSMSLLTSSDNVSQQHKTSQSPVRDDNSNAIDANPLVIDETQQHMTQMEQLDNCQMTQTAICVSNINNTSPEYSRKTMYNNELQSDSGYFEHCYDDETTPIRFNNAYSLKVKKSPLSVRIEDSGSCCNSDDECHESGHITSDSIRNSNETQEWVWGYIYDSEDDDDESMSGPSLAKKIKPAMDTAEPYSNDTTAESNSRRNSFSKRCDQFRFRKGSLSQKMNLYRFKRDPALNVSQHGSTESLNHGNNGVTQNVKPDTFRRRCFTFSQRPSRPIIPAVSTAWNESENLRNNILTTLPKGNFDQDTVDNANEVGQITPRSRSNSNAREFLTARRRCATVSARDLQMKRPILPRRFIEPAGSVDSIPEDEGVSSVIPDNTNNSTNDRGFVRKPDVEGVVRFRKRCSTFTSSRSSSAARELNLTRPSGFTRNSQNDNCNVPFIYNKPHTMTANRTENDFENRIDLKDELVKDRFDPPVKIFENVALPETEFRLEHGLHGDSNISYVNSSSTSARPLYLQPPTDFNPCSKTLNKSASVNKYGLPSSSAASMNINNNVIDMTNKLTLNHNELIKCFQNEGCISSRPPIYLEQKPNIIFPHPESSPLNLSTKPRSNSVQYVLDAHSASKLNVRCAAENDNPDKETKGQGQFLSSTKAWSDQEELHRPRSWSVSSGMSSLSLGGRNRTTVVPPPVDDDDENMWRPW